MVTVLKRRLWIAKPERPQWRSSVSDIRKIVVLARLLAYVVSNTTQRNDSVELQACIESCGSIDSVTEIHLR